MDRPSPLFSWKLPRQSTTCLRDQLHWVECAGIVSDESKLTSAMGIFSPARLDCCVASVIPKARSRLGRDCGGVPFNLLPELNESTAKGAWA